MHTKSFASERSANSQLGKTVVRKVRRPGSTQPDQVKPSNLRDQIGLYRDFLDAVLKTGAVSLPIPAILIFNYLKLLGHSDLFAASVLSLAGLSALLQIFLLLWVALTVSVVTPSGIVCMFLSGTSNKRPTRGLPIFVLSSSVIWAAFYAGAGYFGDGPAPLTWRYWVPVVVTLLVIWTILGTIAWSSKSIVPDSEPEAANWSAPPKKWTTRIANSFRAIWAHRLWRCFCVTAAIFSAGLYAVFSIYVISAFAGSMHLPQHGWKASVVLFVVILFAFFPGSVYLKVRAANGSHGKALKMALVVTVALTYTALLNGVSAEPIALVAMKGMAVIDNTERTYEIIRADERPVYQALGYRPKAGDRFVQAYIRFQFADMKLVCPERYPFLDAPPSNDSDALKAGSGTPVPPKSTKTRADSNGCLVPTKDELRVIDLPDGFSLPSHPTAAGTSKRRAGHIGRSKRYVRHRRGNC